MTKEKLPPLSNDEIRATLLELSTITAELGLTIKAFETLLLQKELVTKAEIDGATAEATAQGKEMAVKIRDATRRGPGTGIQ